MIQPRLADMKRHQIESFNEIKRMMRKGVVPAALLNPQIIKEHNQNSPEVAKITHPGQEVSLDALAVRYVHEGVEARRHWSQSIKTTKASSEEAIEDLDFSTMTRRERHAEIGLSNE